MRAVAWIAFGSLLAAAVVVVFSMDGETGFRVPGKKERQKAVGPTDGLPQRLPHDCRDDADLQQQSSRLGRAADL